MTTTEADWQATLDAAAPEDRAGLMQIFADWLDERENPRGPGYRALGALGKYPMFGGSVFHWWQPILQRWPLAVRASHLPSDWYSIGPLPRGHRSPRAACDLAALAFARLPQSRQAELLALPSVPA